MKYFFILNFAFWQLMIIILVYGDEFRGKNLINLDKYEKRSNQKDLLGRNSNDRREVHHDLQLNTSFPKNLILTNSLNNDNLVIKQLRQEDLIEYTREPSVVLFYVPWCVFCREMMPEFEKVATMLKNKEIRFGKIDANEHRQIVILEQIIKFPTIKVYIEGEGRYYTGLPNAVSIVNFINNEFDRDILITDINSLNVFTNTDQSSIKVIAIVNLMDQQKDRNSSFPVSSSYSKISRRYNNIFFAHTFHNSTEVLNSISNHNKSNKLSISQNKNYIAIFTPWNDFDVSENMNDRDHEPGMILVDNVDFENYNSLEKLITKYQYPLITEFTPFIAQKLFSNNKPIVFLFINKDISNYEEIMKKYKVLANEFRGEINFVKSGISLPHEKRILQLLANEENELPIVSIIKFPEKKDEQIIFPLPNNIPPLRQPQAPLVYRSSIYGLELLTNSNLERFVHDFVSGRLQPYFKSEEPPLEEDNIGPVRVVVSKTFRKEVIDSEIDVLIVFYAPWCGHCRKLEPDYNALAQRLQGLSNQLKIAKIDGSQNEVENIQILGYPTILFFKSQKKDQPIFYSGDRSVPNMIEWLAKHVTNPFDPSHYLNPDSAFEDDDLEMAISNEL